MNKNTQKVALYDWIRLLATLMVVVGHSAYCAMFTAVGGVSYDLPIALSPVYDSIIFKAIRYIAVWVYGFHMPLFFFLSGAVLALKPIGSFNTFAVKKAKKLILPFFAAGLLFMLPVKALSGFYSVESIKSAIGLFVGGVDESGHLWFLWALFWVMVIFAILQKVIERFANGSPALLLISTWIVQMCAASIPITNYQFSAAIKYLFWFACGFVFETYCRRSLTRKRSIALLILAAILELLHSVYSVFTTDTMIVLGILFTVTLSVILSETFTKLYDTKGFKLLARNLFNIYLYHDPLEYVVLKFTFDNGLLETAAGCWFYLFARTIGVTLISILIGELVRIVLKAAKQRIHMNEVTA